MYLWRVKKLSEEFKAGTVSDRKQLPYLLVFIILISVTADSYLHSLLDYQTNSLDLAMLVISLIITVAGTIWCYKSIPNKDSDNGFISRYICLGLPLYIRLMVLMFAIMALITLFHDYIMHTDIINAFLYSGETHILDFILFIFTGIIYFVWLHKAIKSSYNDTEIDYETVSNFR